ncbi:hypothetical protein [Kaarinaea lacus]
MSSEADADALGRRLAALGIATPVVVTPVNAVMIRSEGMVILERNNSARGFA